MNLLICVCKTRVIGGSSVSECDPQFQLKGEFSPPSLLLVCKDVTGRMDKLEWMLNLIMETMGFDATPFQEMKTDLFKKNVNVSQPARTEHRDREQAIPSPDNVPPLPFGWSTVKRVSRKRKNEVKEKSERLVRCTVSNFCERGHWKGCRETEVVSLSTLVLVLFPCQG